MLDPEDFSCYFSAANLNEEFMRKSILERFYVIAVSCAVFGAVGCMVGDFDKELNEEIEMIGEDDGDVLDDEIMYSEEEEAAEAAAESALVGAGAHAFGLGHDADKAVEDVHWDTLVENWREGDWSLRTARTVWNIEESNTTRLADWVDDVSAAGLEPVVSISIRRIDKETGEVIKPVPRNVFKRRFRKLLEEFPEVHYWGVVNEPDLSFPKSVSPLEKRGKYGAKYFVTADRIRRNYIGRKCRSEKKCERNVILVAGEFAYSGQKPGDSERVWKGFRSEIMRALRDRDLHRFPRIWSLHPYADTMSGTADGAWRFDNFLKETEGTKALKLSQGELRSWLTETGTILHASRCEVGGIDLNHNPDDQYRGGRTTFWLNDAPRVDRVYWWEYRAKAGHPWDSALVDWNGNPRPAFCGLTNQGPDGCSGLPFAYQCEATP